MTTAYYSTVLNHPLETVWDLIRDFNNYPAYIDGVTESMIEDDRGGDEVGAIRRFCYLGNWIKQRLAGHSDQTHSLTYAGIDPLPFPSDLLPVVEGNRTFIEWKVLSMLRRRMPIAGGRCSSHGFQTGRIRWSGRWGDGLRERAARRATPPPRYARALH